jgi:hypothetical protein
MRQLMELYKQDVVAKTFNSFQARNREWIKMAVFWVIAPCSLVNFYQTTWRYNPEDSHLRTHHRDNLKSYRERIICFE